jgi:UDP-N-acetylglucosamine--N-acetylmuramyl-(pentapeptide) pyrophosphoryl-undecaprenol N-acetylglucosamine transferase
LSLAHALRKQSPDCRIVYIGLKGEKLEGLQDRYSVFDEAHYISAGKLRRYYGESFLAHLVDIRRLALNVRDFFRTLAGINSASRLLRRLRPAVVFSKGGFVGVPVGIAAHRQHIPIVTHDSDALEGLANRIIGRWATIHTTGMPPTYYRYPPSSVRYVGIPVDERIGPVNPEDQQAFKKQVDLPVDSLLLLVGGGGLGARDLNDLIVKSAKELLERQSNLHIIHIAGRQHQKTVDGQYLKFLTTDQRGRVEVLDFTADFYKYTGAADLVITRAGATTLAELALQRKACVVVPAPFLTGGHQLKNADQLKKLGAVEIVNNNASPQKLVETVGRLLQNEKQRLKLATSLGTTAHPKAAGELAQILLTVAAGDKPA